MFLKISLFPIGDAIENAFTVAVSLPLSASKNFVEIVSNSYPFTYALPASIPTETLFASPPLLSITWTPNGLTV